MRLMLPRAAAGAALLAAVLAATPALTTASAAPAQAPAQARAVARHALTPDAVRACPAPAPGHATCALITSAGAPATARARARGGTRAAGAATPAGLRPSDLQAAYKLQSATQGVRQDVAFIAAGADPTAAADLAAYRSQWNLPPCTTSDGCLTIENQNGGSTLPTTTYNDWPANDALGLDTISAICPNCHLLLVEANTTAISDLAVAASTAATTAGVYYVDNAYAGPEISTETTYDPDYNHPGVAMVAAAGDTGYPGTGNPINYPAASPYVISAGGTILTQSGSTWADTSAWPGTVSGCSLYESAKPAWQTDTGCAGRTDNDVAAAAATETSGIINPLFIAYYNTSNGGTGWTEGGGTTASASIITAIYALASIPGASDNPAAYPYQNGAYGLTDITTGSTGTCGISYLCTAGTGYDAPTGMGAPDGVQSLTPTGYTKGTIYADNFEKCLDNKNGSFTNGNPVQVWDCNGMTNNQIWYLESDGTIRIGSGQANCVGVADGSTANGAKSILWPCNGNIDQQWRMVAYPAISGVAGELVDQKSGKCLDDTSHGNNGTQIVINPCGSDGIGQAFNYLPSVPTGTGEVMSVANTSQCMDNTNGKLTGGNAIQIWDCNGMTNNQIWTIGPYGRIKIGSSWCLTGESGSTKNSLVIQQCSDGTIGQLWRVSSDGSMLNLLINSCVEEQGLTNGTALTLPFRQEDTYCTGNANQEWLQP